MTEPSERASIKPRFASVDLGTNTVLLTIAEWAGPKFPMRILQERATITRLGQGLDATGRLHPEAVARTCACLTRYAEEVRSYGVTKVAVVGTSAMRDAGPKADPPVDPSSGSDAAFRDPGREAILALVRAEFGCDLEIISGEREAKLSFAGAVSGLPNADAHLGITLLFDIGGGSTEFLLAERTAAGASACVLQQTSLQLGSVRLTERFFRHDPPLADEPLALRAFVERELRLALGGMREHYQRGRSRPMPPQTLAVAGTMTTAAAVALGLEPYDGAKVHGHRLSRVTLAALTERLASLPQATRADLPGLEPKRADVIVAGLLIAVAILDFFDQDEVVISDRGVRFGLLEEMIADSKMIAD
jgi:exopolyphosphatase / guanosine-5'-triphosphate,3'-diphosphate pyrophosphatase